MTDQQRELFQTMDQQQKVQFIQRLKQEREMKMRQEQMQMQAAGGAPAGGPPQQFPQQQVNFNIILLRDHPFKTSACLRGRGVSPCAEGQKVTVIKDKKSPSYSVDSIKRTIHLAFHGLFSLLKILFTISKQYF